MKERRRDSDRSALEGTDGFMIDLDGVVWTGSSIDPLAIRALQRLRGAGLPFVFITNDPRSARSRHAARLTDAGLPTQPADVITSSWAAARVISEQDLGVPLAAVIGSPDFKGDLKDHGISVVSGDDHRHATLAVVGGHEGFSYDELRQVTAAARRGVPLFATSRDPNFPMPDGRWPATGAILAAVEMAAGRRATAIGKPEPHMFELARAALPRSQRPVVVGDSLDTDIAGANRVSLPSVLVGGGDHTVTSPTPDLQLPHLSDVVELLLV